MSKPKDNDPGLTQLDAEDWIKFRGENPLQKALVKYDLTPDLIARRLKGELDATITKAQVVEGIVDHGDGPRRVHRWVYSEHMIDWAIQQGARRDLVKLWGGQPKESGMGDDDTPLVVRIKETGKLE